MGVGWGWGGCVGRGGGGHSNEREIHKTQRVLSDF